MQSKNKKAPTQAEKAHILRIKEMNCIICQTSSPSECHEIKQGQWFTSIPLCPDCHRGSINGIHGQKRLWNVKKMDELDALNETIKVLMGEGDGMSFWNLKKVWVFKNLIKSIFKIGHVQNPKNPSLCCIKTTVLRETNIDRCVEPTLCQWVLTNLKSGKAWDKAENLEKR